MGFAITAAVLFFVEFGFYFFGQLSDVAGNVLLQRTTSISEFWFLLISLYTLVIPIYLLIIKRKSIKSFLPIGISLVAYPIIYLIISFCFSYKLSTATLIWQIVDVLAGLLMILQICLKKRQWWIFILLFVHITAYIIPIFTNSDWRQLAINQQFIDLPGADGLATKLYDCSIVFADISHLLFLIADLFLVLFFLKVASEKQSLEK